MSHGARVGDKSRDMVRFRFGPHFMAGQEFDTIPLSRRFNTEIGNLGEGWGSKK